MEEDVQMVMSFRGELMGLQGSAGAGAGADERPPLIVVE